MAASDVILGIDLGTTNSVVSVADEQSVRVLQTPGGDALIPSAVTFHPDGRVLVGASARERRLLDATNTVYSVKRLIGRPFESDEVRRAKSRFAFEFVQSDSGGVLVKARGETYTLSEISAFVLREVRAVAEKALGHPVRKAVVTVPANFNELQRSATKAAGRVAGLDVVRILNEPTAAALAYGHGRSLRERVAVFDLGGGTFDVTILELAGEIFEVQATAGDTYLGGDDIDNLIAEQMAEAFLVQHRLDPRTDRSAYERLRAAAEWAKCQLSSRPDVRVKVEGLSYGEGGKELDLNFNLSTQSLESMAMPLLARAFDVCEEAMRIANTRPTQIDRVILVGGSTRMPLVRRMVAEYFGREPLVDIDPDLVVSQGAAIQGRSLATARARGKIGRVALRKVAPPSRIAIQEVGGGDRQSHVDATGMTLEEDDIEIIEPDELEDEVVLIDFEGARREGRELPAEHQPKASSPPPPGATMRPPGSGPKVPPPLVPAGAIPVGAPPSPAFSSNDLPASRGAPPVDAIPLPMDMPGLDELPMPELSMPVPTEAEPGVPPVIAHAPIVLEAPSGDLPSLDDFGVGGNALGPVGGGVSEAAPPLEDDRPPLLVDVTPLSLSVETVGGYCEAVIARNAAIPTEQSRAFSTAQDDQKEVIFRVCQGESRRLEENQLLGEVALELPGNARRGRPIDVTFLLDAGGTLAVRAVDGQTGQEQRVRIQLIGGVDEEAAAQMAERLDAMYSPSE